MADRLDVFQEIAQVEVLSPSVAKVFQVIGQVEYDGVVLAHNVVVSQVISQVEYGLDPPPKRQFPVPNGNTVWQTQYGKRKFPVMV